MKKWTIPYFSGTDYTTRTEHKEAGETFVRNGTIPFDTLEDAMKWFGDGIERSLYIGYRCPDCANPSDGGGVLCSQCSDDCAQELKTYQDERNLGSNIFDSAREKG